MSRIPILAFGIGLVAMVLSATLPTKSAEDPPLDKLRAKYAKKPAVPVDHAKFPALNREFASPGDVTAACLGCHNKRHEEVMASSHWNWERTEYMKGKGIVQVGKANLLNNFCVGVSGNEQSCSKCHIGYGNEGKSFDYKNPRNVDCLACHDNSDTYVKGSGSAGMPDPSVNLRTVATRVGRPKRANCGTCHFFGGGGNNVKHGDLEKAMFEPERDVDVHMASSGSDLLCVDCHTATNHQMLGKSYSISSMNRDRVACESCHGDLPHDDDTLNRHTAKVACQSCHIPTYAKVNATKTRWDWSTAGRLKEGRPYEEKDADGNDTYLSIKGSFVWQKNVQPEYAWFNGTAEHYLLGDPVEPGKPVSINHLEGSYDDPNAKIVPVKVHRAKQPYDPVNRILIQPKTYSSIPGDGGFWKEFDWTRAAAEGMKEVGQPFSGEVAFIETEMTWPVNHMVSPKEKAVSCSECHRRDGGRLASLKGFYLPGRDRHEGADGAGRFLILATITAVLLHGGARLVGGRRNAMRKPQ